MKNNNIFSVIQITDFHLLSDKQATLKGVNTYNTFLNVISMVTKNKPDALFITGDISQDFSVQSYQYAFDELNKFDIPVYWIPGNHDDEKKIQPIFNTAQHLYRLDHLAEASWDFIAFDTCREGTDSGFFDEKKLAFLIEKLTMATAQQKRIAIVMHHHPYPVGTPLVDACMLQNHLDFLLVLEAFPAVQLIICGHVHGAYHIVHQDKNIESCRATCFQWPAGTSTPEIDPVIGFKTFLFSNEGYSSKHHTVSLLK